MSNAIGINHVTIQVKDKELSKVFFTNTLELDYKIVNEKHLWIVLGNSYIHVSQNPNMAKPNSFNHFSISVTNFSQYTQMLISKGLILYKLGENNSLVPVDSHQMPANCFLYDPDLNIIEIVDASSSFFNEGTII